MEGFVDFVEGLAGFGEGLDKFVLDEFMGEGVG